MCFCFGSKTETETKPKTLCPHIQTKTWLKPDRNRTETEPKQNRNRTETKPKHNHIILIGHCFVSVSVFSWNLEPKQKRNRKLLVPPHEINVANTCFKAMNICSPMYLWYGPHKLKTKGKKDSLPQNRLKVQCSWLCEPSRNLNKLSMLGQ